jgi:hypothetical protein
MPEPLFKIPFTGDLNLDTVFGRIRGKLQDLEDAMAVQAHLEKRRSELIKEHSERIREHSERLRHFEEKLDALADIIMRCEGGPKAG